MKTRQILFLLLALACLQVGAKNTVVKVAQVTEAVSITSNTDYVITGSTPFAVTGSIDIVNTEHAVVILQGIRPSAALSYLSFIKINGQEAVNDVTCQVKMYAQGSIIMPYGADIKPLTVYSEQNFGGTAVNDFGLEHSNGYMNTLNAAKLNNQIRSFKLKRGYMVTFALKTGGYGYSRCFIAADDDLEMPILPQAMDKRISSYRIFKWYDAEKKGLANSTNYEATQALNVSWCYSFGLGEDRGIDCECVPHHIYEDWPSSRACGATTYSPHMKTNNEPGNPSDDRPQSVETILANWQNLMATGMRLCSPSSHDGSLNHLREFMQEIDARGWRCDILDMHCYWTAGQYSGLQSWYNTYKRPIWVSEFVLGASWNNNGIFATDRSYSIENQQKNYDGMKPVLESMNSWPYIERYAYWNSEADCSKVYKDGGLSILGNFYSTMQSGMAYNKAYEFVPKVVLTAPTGITLEYDKTTRTLQIKWTNANGEWTDSTRLERKTDDGDWETIEQYNSSEKESYLYYKVLPEDFPRANYIFRAHNYDMDGTERFTDEVYLSLSGSSGSKEFQYGTLTFTDTEEQTAYITALDEGSSIVVLGSISNNNTNVVPVPTLKRSTSTTFGYGATTWSYSDSYSTTLTNAETTDFVAVKPGVSQYGDITVQAAQTSRVNGDSTWITFEQPYPEGVTPVVIASVVTRLTKYATVARVWNITNEGFAVQLTREAGSAVETPTFAGQYVNYVAANPGQATLPNGMLLHVGFNSSDRVNSARSTNVKLLDPEGKTLYLDSPYLLCATQTKNYVPMTVCRVTSLVTRSTTVEDVTYTGTYAIRATRNNDPTDTTAPTEVAATHSDYLGWMAISNNPLPTAIGTPAKAKAKVIVEQGVIKVEGTTDYRIISASGMPVPQGTRLRKGIYIVVTPNGQTKVAVP